MEGYISTREAAAIIGTDTNYASQMCRNKVLNCMLSGGRWMVERASAEKYRLRKMKNKTRPARDSADPNQLWEFLKKAEPLIKKFGFDEFMSISEMIVSKKSHPESIRKFWMAQGANPRVSGKTPRTREGYKDMLAEYEESLRNM